MNNFRMIEVHYFKVGERSGRALNFPCGQVSVVLPVHTLLIFCAS